MIVATMTEAELKAEVMQDMHNVLAFSNFIDKKFRRAVLKRTRFPVYETISHSSRRENNWLLFYEARTRKEVNDNVRMTLVCTYNTKHGLHAIMFTNTNKQAHLIMYPPHFFSRYAERMKIELTGIELMKAFFKHNNSYVYEVKRKQLSETTYINECYGTGNDGVSLGFLTTEGNMFFKTFITYDMLKGEQIEKFIENEKLRKEIHGR